MNELRVRWEFRARFLPAALAAWIAYSVADFLMHGVFLARWWRATGRYWLPPDVLLRMIPLGYAAFAIYCCTMIWLLARLCGARPSVGTGLRFGASAGLISGAVSVLAAYSVFSMPHSALGVWPLSVVLGSAVAGAVGAWTLAAQRPWRRTGLVLGLAFIALIAGVVIQNLWLRTPGDHIVK